MPFCSDDGELGDSDGSDVPMPYTCLLCHPFMPQPLCLYYALPLPPLYNIHTCVPFCICAPFALLCLPACLALAHLPMHAFAQHTALPSPTPCHCGMPASPPGGGLVCDVCVWAGSYLCLPPAIYCHHLLCHPKPPLPPTYLSDKRLATHGIFACQQHNAAFLTFLTYTNIFFLAYIHSTMTFHDMPIEQTSLWYCPKLWHFLRRQ